MLELRCLNQNFKKCQYSTKMNKTDNWSFSKYKYFNVLISFYMKIIYLRNIPLLFNAFWSYSYFVVVVFLNIRLTNININKESIIIHIACRSILYFITLTSNSQIPYFASQKNRNLTVFTIENFQIWSVQDPFYNDGCPFDERRIDGVKG